MHWRTMDDAPLFPVASSRYRNGFMCVYVFFYGCAFALSRSPVAIESIESLEDRGPNDGDPLIRSIRGVSNILTILDFK